MQDITLTPDQSRAKARVMQRIASGKKYTSLTGHAGTGKTTTTAQIMRDLQKEKRQVYACAPTHKASWVMTEKMPAEAGTIHSLLGLVLVPNNFNGGYALVPKNGDRQLPTEGVVLLDESSMVGSGLWEYVEETTGQSSELQWVFAGDPAQLPPVRQRRAPALSAPGGHLEHVVRQEAGNPILDLATRVRQGQKYLDAARKGEHSEGKGVAVTSSIQSFTQSALATFRDVPGGQAPPARIITYTNKRATGYNHRIRSLLHGSTDLPPYVEGDWLMMKDTYMDGDGTVLARNSEEVKVLGADTKMVWSAGEQWRVWQVKIERPQLGGVATEIPLLHRSHYRAYEKKLAQLKSKAKSTGGNRRWRDYYRLNERFADAEYCFAMTAHRSQGSTFHTAYVDHQNLRRCRNPEERQAMIYVAATRPSHQLALLV
jgi:exodeoxyribonuclease-5